MEKCDYRKRLARLDDELYGMNFKILKFLCEPLIGGSAHLKSPLEVFDILENRRYLSPDKMTVIHEALAIMQRIDLIEDVVGDRAAAWNQGSQLGDLAHTSMICPFRAVLVNVSENLPDTDLNKITFIYKKVPKRTKLQDGLELFQFMLQRSDVKPSNVTQLIDLLNHVDRQDLAESLINFQGRYIHNGVYTWRPGDAGAFCKEEEEMPGPVEESTFQGLDHEEPSSSASTNVANAELGWEMTSNMQALNTPQVTGMTEASSYLGACGGGGGQALPMDIGDTYCTGPPESQNSFGEPSAQITSASYSTFNNQLAEIQGAGNNNKAANFKSAEPLPPENNNIGNRGFSDQPEPRMDELGINTNSSAADSGITGSSVTSNEGTRLVEEDSVPYYKMDANPRGMCVIIDIEEFDNSDRPMQPLQKREGSHIDREALTRTFENLHFIVVSKVNLDANELVDYLQEVSTYDHSSYDCFVTCILSHGGSGFVYGSDGLRVKLEDITACFRATNCKSLAGKPKLFFLAYCQGKTDQPAVTPDDLATDGPENPVYSQPNEADFLLGLATVPGYVAYRSRSQGTWYIQALCRVLDRYAHREDLNDILLRVNREVSEKTYDKLVSESEGTYSPKKQVPAPQHTLLKKLKFLP